MSDTLKWRLKGELFEDGSRLSDWHKIKQSTWQWQYDTHELAFDNSHTPRPQSRTP